MIRPRDILGWCWGAFHIRYLLSVRYLPWYYLPTRSPIRPLAHHFGPQPPLASPDVRRHRTPRMRLGGKEHAERGHGGCVRLRRREDPFAL